jgi:hypothetical protein
VVYFQADGQDLLSPELLVYDFLLKADLAGSVHVELTLALRMAGSKRMA